MNDREFLEDLADRIEGGEVVAIPAHIERIRDIARGTLPRHQRTDQRLMERAAVFMRQRDQLRDALCDLVLESAKHPVHPVVDLLYQKWLELS